LWVCHYTDTIRETGRTQVAATPLTPASDLDLFRQLGCHVTELPLSSSGQITAEVLREQVRPRLSLLSIPWADPITGVLQPIEEIAAVCREHQIRLHVDLSAAVGQIPLSIGEMAADFITIGSLGIVYEGVPFSDPIVPSDVRLKALAAEFGRLLEQGESPAMEVARLRSLFETSTTAPLLFQDVERLSHTSVVHCPEIHPDALLFFLHHRGVQARRVPSHPSAIALQFTSGMSEMRIQAIVTVLGEVMRDLMAIRGGADALLS
jgi:cysteine desulfurase